MNAAAFAATLDKGLAPHVTAIVNPSPDLVNCGEGADTSLGIRSLSPRFRQTAQAVSEGLSNKEIGRRVGITEATVKVHLKGLLSRLHLNNRTQLAAWWLTGGRESSAEAVAERGPRNAVEWDEKMLDTLRRIVGAGVELSVIRAAFGHLYAVELQEGFFLLLRDRDHIAS